MFLSKNAVYCAVVGWRGVVCGAAGGTAGKALAVNKDGVAALPDDLNKSEILILCIPESLLATAADFGEVSGTIEIFFGVSTGTGTGNVLS